MNDKMPPAFRDEIESEVRHAVSGLVDAVMGVVNEAATSSTGLATEMGPSVRQALAALVPAEPTDTPTVSVQIAARDAEIERLRSVLRFYAHGNHMILADENAWDTVSGEEENWWCDEAGTATIEDGSFAVGVLSGKPLDWGDDGPPAPLGEEKAGTAESKTPITREWCIAAAQAELASEADPTVGAGSASEAAQPADTSVLPPPDPRNTGIGPWCHPSDCGRPVGPRWRLDFEDRDRGSNVYDERYKAYRDFARSEALGWNCHLWVSAPRAPADTEAQVQDVMRLIVRFAGDAHWQLRDREQEHAAIESAIRRLVGGK